MNVKDASTLLGVSAGKVYALAAPGGPIPCTRIGKRIIFDRSDVLEYQQSCRFTEIKIAARSSLSSTVRLKANESALLKHFQKLGIKPKLMLTTAPNLPASTQSLPA